MAYPIDAILGPVSVFKVPVANTDGTTPQEGDVLYRDTNGNPQWGSSAVVARSLVQLANLAAIQAQATISRTKVYVAADTGKQYMWTGEGAAGNWTVAEVNAGLALGETSATAYRGDRGKTAYDHSQAIATAAEFVAGTDKTKNATVGFLKDATALDGFWLTRRTKMPDGATIKTPTDAAWTGWNAIGGATKSVVNGKLRLICASGGGYLTYTYPTPAVYGEVLFVRGKVLSGTPATYNLNARLDTTTTEVSIGTMSPSGLTNNFYAFIKPSGATTLILYVGSSSSGVYTAEFEVIAVGSDLSYLDGSLSEEAARVVNQLGDTTGVGAKATTTLTSNGTNVSNGDTVTLAGKVYTFKTALTPAEGEVLIGATYTDSLDNLVAAITGGAGNGTLYSCAAAHPLVTASRSGAVVTITALQAGILGNQITTAKSAATLTLANPAGGTTTLSGGYDDVGAKVMAQIKLIADTARTAGEIPKLATGGNINVNGVAFPATQSASSDPNTLDDYEEGTWTPTLLGSTTPGTPTYTVQYGFYTKVGRKVTLDFIVTISAKNDMAGNLQIGGIPFVSTSASGFRASGAIGYALGVTYSSEKTSIALLLYNGKSVIEVLQSGSASNSSGLPIENIASSTTISASITYIV